MAKKIKLLREEKELTQAQLAQAVKMTQRKISYMENDKYEPGLEDMRLLCSYFNISADYLLGFSRNLPFPKRKKG